MSSVFPITDDPRYRRYTASAGQTVFPIPFPFLQGEDLKICLQTAPSEYTIFDPADYTLSGANDPAGGTVTLDAGRTAGDIILVLGEAILDRMSSIVRDGRFSSSLIDSELDRIRIIEQEFRRDNGRSVKVDYGGTGLTLAADLQDGDTVMKEGDRLVAGPDIVAIGDAVESAKNIVEGWASDVVSQGSVPIYATVAGMPGLEIPVGINAIMVNGRSAAGDGYGGLYIDQNNGSNDSFVTADGRTWYKVPDVNPDRLGDVDAIRDVLSPLRNFAADGVTNDTARFANLRLMYPDQEFDLRGKTYRVDAVPNGPFKNGCWRVRGAGEGGGTIDYPARGTMKADARKIAWGDRLSNWPQDKACCYNNVLYTAWMEGDNHIGADMHIRIARSFNNGKTWERFERHFIAASGARGSFSMGICHGRLVLFVREHVGAFEDATISANRLYSRRCGERRERKNNPITGVDSSSMSIVATNGSATIRVASLPRHGCLVGDVINITNVAGTVGGRTISGNYTVTATGTDYVEFTHPTGAATSSQTNTSDFVVNFVEGAFAAQTVGGVSFHEAVKGFSGSAYAAVNTWYVHSFCEDPTDDGGAFFAGITGGGVGTHIAKVSGMISGGRTLSKLTLVNANVSRGEPTIKRLADGRLVGFLRTNSASLSGGFFYSTNGGDTWTVKLNVIGTGNDFRYSPIPLAVVNDRIYATATGNRLRAESGTGQEGDVPLYLLEADADEAIAVGWPAFSVMRIGSVRFANESYADTGNGVGVGSMVFNDGVLSIFMASEDAENVGAVLGAPDILCMRIVVDDEPYLDDLHSRTSTGLAHQGEPDVQYAGIFRGFGAAYTLGKVFGDGARSWGPGFTSQRVAAGIYNVTFSRPLSSTEYHLSLSSDGAANLVAGVTGKTTSGFTVNMRDVTASGGLADGAFTFGVFHNEQWMRSDWVGLLT